VIVCRIDSRGDIYFPAYEYVLSTNVFLVNNGDLAMLHKVLRKHDGKKITCYHVCLQGRRCVVPSAFHMGLTILE
jgi:hypothetical protein